MARRIAPDLTAVGIKVVEKTDRPDVASWGTPDEVYDLVDLWPVRDGNWLPANRQLLDVPQWAQDDYYRRFINPADPLYNLDIGGAVHLFQIVLDQNGAPLAGKGLLWWSDGLNTLPPNSKMTQRAALANGAGNIPIEGGDSGFTPPNLGPWCMCPFGLSDVVINLGRPFGWHVAIFAVWRARAAGSVVVPPVVVPPVTPPPVADPGLTSAVASLANSLPALTSAVMALDLTLRRINKLD